MDVIHNPVLLKESIEGLNLKKGATVVDATLGGGGHSREILKIIGADGRLIAIDQDENAVENFNKYLKSEDDNLAFLPACRQAVKDNFSNLGEILRGQKIDSADGVLADLGYSSIQLEDESYGMSFLKDAPLDMRLDKENKLTAEKIVNEYSQAALARIIKNYGEERFANSIAKKIIEQRKIKPINRTLELVEIISQAVPEKYKHAKIPQKDQRGAGLRGKHFATRTFQSIRIEVNQELENLEKFIPQAIEALGKGGRLVIISFHSLEDRIVKNIFRENARGCICPPNFPVCVCGREAMVHLVKSAEGGPATQKFNRVKIITKKPITPSFKEIQDNPRSRSAKLRICEKI